VTQVVLFYMQTTVFSTYQQQINSIFVHVFTFIFLSPVPLLFHFLPINQHTIHYTPSHYMAPSPLCVLLTQCYDDVHSAGGGGRMLLGRGLGHDVFYFIFLFIYLFFFFWCFRFRGIGRPRIWARSCIKGVHL
jgi:hypothetical protein